MPAFLTTHVQLDAVIFRGFEVPEAIPFGGAHQLNIHKLPGGARVIDAMGRDDQEISWSAKFLSDDAVPRARALDALRIAGQSVILSWGEFLYSVIVSNFEASYEQINLVPFKITLTVLQDLTTPQAIDEDYSIDVLFATDLSTAISEAAALANAPISAALGLIQTGIGQIGSLVGLSASAVSGLQGSIASAQGLVRSATGAANLALSSFTTLGGLVPGQSGPVGAAQLTSVASFTSQLPSLNVIDNSLTRMSANLDFLGT
jgi:hypothetical protein